MKQFILLIITLFILSCDDGTKRVPITTTECNIINAKDQPIENRLSGGDFIFGNGSITKSQTIYYFYFENGTSKEVNREEFFKFNVGDKYCVSYTTYKTIPNQKLN